MTQFSTHLLACLSVWNKPVRQLFFQILYRVIFYEVVSLVSSPAANLEDQTSVFIYLRDMAALLFPQAMVFHHTISRCTMGLLSSALTRSLSFHRVNFLRPHAMSLSTLLLCALSPHFTAKNISHSFLRISRGDPGSIPGLVKWGLWWTKWRWGRFSPSTSVSPANIHSTE
jgi:hypothetical protein